MTSGCTDPNIIYPIVHNYKRLDKVIARREKYEGFDGYCGKRYLANQSSELKYWTIRSVYVRHRELTKKYHYDFNPNGSYVLANLQKRWEQKLQRYLSMYSSGQFVKKRSSRDKMKFKQENGFELKKNPLFRMVQILDKLNYLFVVQKLFKVSSELNCKTDQAEQTSVSQNFLNYDSETASSNFSDSEKFTQVDSRSTNETDQIQQFDDKTEKTNKIFKRAKILKLFEFYQDEWYGGKRSSKETLKRTNTIKLRTKKYSRKPMKQYTLQNRYFTSLFEQIAQHY